MVFDTEGSYAVNKDTGEVNNIEDDGVNFKMIHWIVPENEVANVMAMIEAENKSGFTRQG